MTAVKKCIKCGFVRSVAEFYIRDQRAGKLSSHCKPCVRESARKWKAANYARHAELTAKWKAEHPERVLIAKKKWRDANKERSEELIRDWGRRNRHKTREICARRYAAKTKATPVWADAASIRTVYAKAVLLGMTVDHIVPLRSRLVCGLHTWHNLQLLSSTENRNKANSQWPDMPTDPA